MKGSYFPAMPHQHLWIYVFTLLLGSVCVTFVYFENYIPVSIHEYVYYSSNNVHKGVDNATEPVAAGDYGQHSNISDKLNSGARPGTFSVYRSSGYTTWVNSSGDFLSKVDLYNEIIDQIRKKLTRHFSNWNESPIPEYQILEGCKEWFLDIISQADSTVTVFLEWTQANPDDTSSERISNLLLDKFYVWGGSKSMCQHLIGRGKFTKHFWNLIFNKQCETNIDKSTRPRPLDLFVLNTHSLKKRYSGTRKIPSEIYTDVPKYIFYIHILENAYVTNSGIVYSADKKIIPCSCKAKVNSNPPGIEFQSSPIFEEVFVISQLWGQAYYHRLLEALPRLAPYIPFLRRNPQIKIHSCEQGPMIQELLGQLGLSPDRLVSGPVRSKVVYLPQATYCHLVQVQATQYLSYLFRKKITERRSRRYHQKNLILIRRSGERHFVQNDVLAREISKLAYTYNLKFYLFRDDPVPSLEETMDEFNRAAMVVGPHGAGLSNLVFCEPGTYVIEGLCNPPETNMCFTRLAHVLGHRYHGLISKEGCEHHVNISVSEIAQTVRKYLILMKQRGDI